MAEQTVEQVPIGKVKPAKDNPRRKIGDVAEMAMSMRELGVIEPILATRNNGSYEVVAGARRLAAAELAGLDTVPVIVREFTPQERLLAMTIENLQREDLTAVEEANAYQRLLDELQISQRDLANRVGKTQSHISKRIGLLALPKDVQAKVDSGGITIADAVELGKLADHPAQLKKALEGPNYQSLDVRISHELHAIEREKKIVKLEEEMESNGLATVRVANEWNLPKGLHRLKGGNSGDLHALQLTAKQHEAEPCHAIAIDQHGLGFPVCTNRKNHPKIKTKQEADRGTSRTANRPGGFRQPKETPAEKKLKQARERRLAFVGELVKKKPAKDAIQFILTWALEDAFIMFEGDPALDRVAIWLGLAQPLDDPESGSTRLADDVNPELLIREFAHRGEAELHRAALATVAAGTDAGYQMDILLAGRQNSQYHGAERAYLEFLRSQGDTLTDLELKHLDEAPPAAKAA